MNFFSILSRFLPFIAWGGGFKQGSDYQVNKTKKRTQKLIDKINKERNKK